MALGFSYYGGKVKLAEWIISHFPEHDTYIEPFGGGAAVLLNKLPSGKEIYNDRDQLIVNLFSVIRDHFEEFARKVYWSEKSTYLTQWSDELITSGDDWQIPDVDRALALFMRFTIGISTRMTSTMGGITLDPSHILMSDRVQAKLKMIHNRFEYVNIMNMDVFDLLSREWVDRDGVLIYLDPPYLGNQEGYNHKFSSDDHNRFISVLAGLKHAMWVLSGFLDPMYEAAAQEYGWHVVTRQRTAFMSGGAAEGAYGISRPQYTEMLISNYEPAGVQMSLF